jgi:hypothetical protein
MTPLRNKPAARISTAKDHPETPFGLRPAVDDAATAELLVVQARSKAAREREPSDNVLIRTQMERAKKDLERVQVALEREAEQTQVKLAQIEEALQAAQVASPNRSKKFRVGKTRGMLMGVASILVVTAGGFGTMKILKRPTNSVPAETTAAPLATQIAPVGAPESGNSLSEFSNGVGRLSHAFSRFPGVDPETIMRAVNKKAAASGSSVCAFAWNDGQPALQFGGGRGGNTSLSGTLTRCAEAVERFR